METKNVCIVITGPSGVGKSSVINQILANVPVSVRLVSTTSRSPRTVEKNGKDYFFVTREEFELMIGKNEFLEYEENYGNYYGTSRTKLNEYLSNNKVVIIGGIDTRGAKSIKKALPEAVTIFLKPDSIDNLKKRLEKRGDTDKLQERIDQAEIKIAQANDFDYIVVNEQNLERQAGLEIFGIIASTWSKRNPEK